MRFVPSTPENLRPVPRAYGVPVSETPIFALSVMFFVGVGALAAWASFDDWRKKRAQTAR